VDCLAYSVLAANRFSASSSSGGPSVLLPGPGAAYASDYCPPSRSTGALGYGAEGGPPPSARNVFGA
jgi:hypothetical protein